MENNQFDLSCQEVFSAQMNNADKYEKRSIFAKIGFALFALTAILIFLLDPVPNLIWGIYAVSLAFAVIGTWFARCPNCGSLQPGKVYRLSFTEDSFIASYSAGISPFAKRCVKCSYYLSKKKLLKESKYSARRGD